MLENLLMFYFENFRFYSILSCIFMTTITWHTMLQTEALGNTVLVPAGLILHQLVWSYPEAWWKMATVWNGHGFLRDI